VLNHQLIPQFKIPRYSAIACYRYPRITSVTHLPLVLWVCSGYVMGLLKYLYRFNQGILRV